MYTFLWPAEQHAATARFSCSCSRLHAASPAQFAWQGHPAHAVLRASGVAGHTAHAGRAAHFLPVLAVGKGLPFLPSLWAFLPAEPSALHGSPRFLRPLEVRCSQANYFAASQAGWRDAGLGQLGPKSLWARAAAAAHLQRQLARSISPLIPNDDPDWSTSTRQRAGAVKQRASGIVRTALFDTSSCERILMQQPAALRG